MASRMICQCNSFCHRLVGFEKIYAHRQVLVRSEVNFTMFYEWYHVPAIAVPLCQSRFCTRIFLLNPVGGLQISVGVRSNHRCFVVYYSLHVLVLGVLQLAREITKLRDKINTTKHNFLDAFPPHTYERCPIPCVSALPSSTFLNSAHYQTPLLAFLFLLTAISRRVSASSAPMPNSRSRTSNLLPMVSAARSFLAFSLRDVVLT